jgi:hypothetical protein
MATDEQPQPQPQVAGKGRRITAAVLIALATLLAYGTIMAIWVNRQVMNTDNWTRTSTEILEQPAVQNLLAARLTDALYSSVDVEAALRDVLPPRAEPLAGPAANALRGEVEKIARKALARPDVQRLWADANRVAHEQFVAVLEGGGTTVSTQQGKVVLNLKPLLDELQQQVGVGGRLVRALPASATQIQVLDSDQLKTGQRVARGLRPLPVILLLLSLGCGAIAIWISYGRRRKVLRAYGIGLVVAGVAALITRSVAGDAVVHGLVRTAAGEPVGFEVWSIGTDLLNDIATASIVYGAVMVIAAWLAGPTRWATSVRRVITPYLREPAIAYGVLAVVVALLVWWAPTPAWRNGIMLAILVGLLIAGVEVLRRQVIREFPDATRAEAIQRRRERFQRLSVAGKDRASALKTWTADRASAASETVGSATREAIKSRSGSPEDARIVQLERLGKLRESGVLDAEEFAAEKRRILDGQEPVASN